MASRTRSISRFALKPLLDSHIYDQLSHDRYTVTWCNPRTLLTPNRLDLAFRLLYLSKRSTFPELSSAVYKEDIRAQSLGTFQDPHNLKKATHLDFKHSFDSLAQSINSHSYDPSHGLVPLASDGTILNGSHRVACSIYYGNEVACVHTELSPYIINDKFYARRGVDDILITASIREYLEFSSNSYIACLWPSSYSIHSQALELLPNKIAVRKLKLNLPSALSILHLCYRGMGWIGNSSTNYSGIYSKLYETFTDFTNFKAIAFSANSLDEVITIKRQIRSLADLEFSSIHITDTPEEAISLSRVLFNPSHYDLLCRLVDRTPYDAIEYVSNLLDSPHPLDCSYRSGLPSITCAKDLSSTVSLANKILFLDSLIANPSIFPVNIAFRDQGPSFYSSLLTGFASFVTVVIYRGYVVKHSLRRKIVATLNRYSLYAPTIQILNKLRTYK